jgi:diguanylate cyclase (GGDEF)-like protein
MQPKDRPGLVVRRIIGRFQLLCSPARYIYRDFSGGSGVSRGQRLAAKDVTAVELAVSGIFDWSVVTTAGIVGCGVPSYLALKLFQRLRATQSAHRDTLATMGQRSRTVDRILEFSQTIQAAGKPEQIFDSLTLFLHHEFKLSGIAILAHDPESLPSTTLKALFPADLAKQGCSVAEMDTGLCPCIRQNLPRCFKPEASPVRCSLDDALKLPPDHPAFCIPFTVGRKTQCTVHMLLPPGSVWTEELRQLAQTYVNAASSSLITLHHLAEAEKQSLTDSLTGLYNRRSMEQLMSREVALAERHGGALSLVMIDMDKFKEINDEHGHAAGDHLLRAFADCVRITLRKTDLAFRYGGDEFCIALPQTGVEQARAVVQKLRQAFSAVDFSDAIAHLNQQPTLSIGVAERSAKDALVTLPALLAAADAALYEAKKDNRDCIKVFSPAPAAA